MRAGVGSLRASTGSAHALRDGRHRCQRVYQWRANRALASGGAVAFASSSLNANYLPALVNNGINDNVAANAWIAGVRTAGNMSDRLSGRHHAGRDRVGRAERILGPFQFHVDAAIYHRRCSQQQRELDADRLLHVFGRLWHHLHAALLFGFGGISNVTGIRVVSTNVACAGNQQCIQELEAYRPPPAVPFITTQPVGGFVTAGDDFTFTIVAVQADSIQWRKNGVNIGGAIGTSYGLLNVQTNDAGTHTVVLTNMLGAVTSSPAVLTITGPPVYANYTKRRSRRCSLPLLSAQRDWRYDGG